MGCWVVTIGMAVLGSGRNVHAGEILTGGLFGWAALLLTLFWVGMHMLRLFILWFRAQWDRKVSNSRDA